VTNSTFVTSNGTQPSNLRLQFATAGGGVYLSGPTVSPASTFATLSGTPAAPMGNATQVSAGLWAGWSSAPAVMVANETPVAATSWPFAAGAPDASNSSILPGVGVFAKAHTIIEFPVFRHVSIRIVPRDQDFWRQREPDIFKEFDVQTERYFGTIGAGLPTGDTGVSCSGVLTSDFNRQMDVQREARAFERLRYANAAENLVIAELIAANRSYADHLRYECFPDVGENEYNSNSYAAGILKLIGLPYPKFPAIGQWMYPGWSKAVPSSEFAR
jgi:hypothetical protein